MSDLTEPTPNPEHHPGPDSAGGNGWKRRAILIAVGVAVAFLLYLFATLFLPVWWATRIVSQNDGTASGGWIAALSLGFIFTLVPLVVAWQMRIRKLHWRGRLAILVVAILLAAPNWLTLGIFLNSSDAALKARRILDTGATWFGGASLTGAIAAAVIFVAGVIGWTLYRGRGRRLKQLKGQFAANPSGATSIDPDPVPGHSDSTGIREHTAEPEDPANGRP